MEGAVKSYCQPSLCMSLKVGLYEVVRKNQFYLTINKKWRKIISYNYFFNDKMMLFEIRRVRGVYGSTI